jgi:hypothetical protein
MNEQSLEVKPDQRVRFNFGMNAKGLVQMDITVEFGDADSAKAEALKAIDAYRAVCAEKGLKLVEPVA